MIEIASMGHLTQMLQPMQRDSSIITLLSVPMVMHSLPVLFTGQAFMQNLPELSGLHFSLRTIAILAIEALKVRVVFKCY